MTHVSVTNKTHPGIEALDPLLVIRFSVIPLRPCVKEDAL